MDVMTSPIIATRFFTTETRRVRGVDEKFRVTRDWGISIVGDETEGYVLMGPPHQLLASWGHAKGDDRVLEQQSPLPSHYVDLPSSDTTDWHGELHFKHPTI